MKKALLIVALSLFVLIGFNLSNVRKIERDEFHSKWGDELKAVEADSLFIESALIKNLDDDTYFVTVNSEKYFPKYPDVYLEVKEEEYDALVGTRVILSDQYDLFVHEGSIENFTYEEYLELMDYITKSYTIQKKKQMKKFETQNKREGLIKSSWETLPSKE